MADILEKIGRYFADQEAQVRGMYAHAAAAASSSSSSSATRAVATMPQPPPRGETDVANTRSRRHKVASTAPTPSLLRRRLSMDKTRVEENGTRAKDVSSSWTGGGEVFSLSRKLRSASVGGLDAAWGDAISEAPSTASLATDTLSASCTRQKSVGLMLRKKKKKQKKTTKRDDEKAERDKAELRATEGLARAQERAKRIHQEKMMQERQQQLEREANTARLAEEMRKIEAIRRKGKQFAMRLRPQSAPTTPQSQTSLQLGLDISGADGEVRSDHAIPEAVSPTTNARVLDGLEQELVQQMRAEMYLNETIHDARSREEEEWTRLEAQLKKTNQKNAIKQERVNTLARNKQDLLREISANQAEAAALRHERHQLEEKSKRERQQKQREAEREIQARLRREESQRLVDEERAQSDHAAEARAKAKMRVQSRAALLKRVLHGCDIRSTTSQNQEEEEKVQVAQKSKTPTVIEAVPELAEFEEDGLDGGGTNTTAIELMPLPSPEKTVRCQILQAKKPDAPSFKWLVPTLTMPEIHAILREEIGDSQTETSSLNPK